MTPEQKQQAKTAIEQAISDTEEDIASLKEKTAPIAPDVSLGRLSRMEAIGEKSILEANLRQAEAKLQGLRKAQHHIDDDDFGECVDCGETIPLGRLLLLPHTEHCVNCAE